MDKNIKMLSENQNKLVNKILEQEKEIEELKNRIKGLETIFLNANVSKDALDLHQSKSITYEMDK